MIELLMELGNMGLQLDPSKTKRKLTTTVFAPLLHVEIGNDLVEVLHDACTHKYLGRILTGNLFTRVAGRLNLNLPIVYGCLGQKFHKHRETLINKHVSLKLRLKYFNAMISPTILFGLSLLPLTKLHFHKLNVVQRRMLRSIVGWVAVNEDD